MWAKKKVLTMPNHYESQKNIASRLSAKDLPGVSSSSWGSFISMQEKQYSQKLMFIRYNQSNITHLWAI